MMFKKLACTFFIALYFSSNNPMIFAGETTDETPNVKFGQTFFQNFQKMFTSQTSLQDPHLEYHGCLVIYFKHKHLPHTWYQKFGSALMVGPNIILTAAHNLYTIEGADDEVLQNYGPLFDKAHFFTRSEKRYTFEKGYIHPFYKEEYFDIFRLFDTAFLYTPQVYDIPFNRVHFKISNHFYTVSPTQKIYIKGYYAEETLDSQDKKLLEIRVLNCEQEFKNMQLSWQSLSSDKYSGIISISQSLAQRYILNHSMQTIPGCSGALLHSVDDSLSSHTLLGIQTRGNAHQLSWCQKILNTKSMANVLSPQLCDHFHQQYTCFQKEKLYHDISRARSRLTTNTSSAISPLLFNIQADEDYLIQIEFLKKIEQVFRDRIRDSPQQFFFSFSGRGREVFTNVFGFTPTHFIEFGDQAGEQKESHGPLFPPPTSHDYTFEAIDHFLTTHPHIQSLRVINLGVSENTREVVEDITDFIKNSRIGSYHSPNYFLQNHMLGIEAQKIASLLLPN